MIEEAEVGPMEAPWKPSAPGLLKSELHPKPRESSLPPPCLHPLVHPASSVLPMEQPISRLPSPGAPTGPRGPWGPDMPGPRDSAHPALLRLLHRCGLNPPGLDIGSLWEPGLCDVMLFFFTLPA